MILLSSLPLLKISSSYLLSEYFWGFFLVFCFFKAQKNIFNNLGKQLNNLITELICYLENKS